MAEKHIQAQKHYVKIQGACRKVGVSVNTIKSWIQRYRAGKEKMVHPFKLIHMNY